MPSRREPGVSGRGESSRPEGRAGAGGGAPAHGPGSELEADLPWELPHSFLGLEGKEASWEGARALILPVPYEATTSFGGGTGRGPAAILEASRYVELYDQELGGEPGSLGVHTLPALELSRAGPGKAMAELREAYATILEAAGDRFPILLGGEHSVSGPAIRVHAEREGGSIAVLQLDAHADLRESYQGTPHSHASVMHGVLDVAEVVAVGVRGVSAPEVEVANREGVTLIWADEMWEEDRWMDRALEALGDPVYLTFDVDYFDPSLVPSTGTPEPGGGDWYHTLRFLRRVFRERRVVGCDVVELAPTPGVHAPDFLVAKLVYKLLGYRLADEVRAASPDAGP